MQEELFNHTQALQQAISTIVTCRTLIKYNSTLNTEQRAEILGEIETTLATLGQRLESSSAPPADLNPEQLADYVIPATDSSAPTGHVFVEASQEQHELVLRQIDHLYRHYLSHEPGQGLETIETRYKSAMHGLEQLQELATLRSDTTASDLTIDELLCRIRGFITALYTLFREFAALFSKAIEGQSIEADTEAMVLQSSDLQGTSVQTTPDLTPLVRVYEKQCRIRQKRGTLHETVRDATAFLIFLQENLEQTRSRRQEIIAQLRSTASLLSELIALVKDYEMAIALIMQSPSTSR